MGLVLKVKPLQRIQIGENLTLETYRADGRIALHFIAKKPFEFDIRREDLTLYKSRMNSGGENGTQERDEIRRLHKKK